MSEFESTCVSTLTVFCDVKWTARTQLGLDQLELLICTMIAAIVYASF